MSVFTEARVSFVMADFVGGDQSGKLNIIGGGITFLALQPPTGQATAPFGVIAMADIPAKLVGTQYAISLELYNETLGQVAQVPGPSGQLEAMRVQQVAAVQPLPPLPGAKPPSDAFVRHVMMLNFSNGLPLLAGCSYDWKLQIDGQHKPGWFSRFHVLAPAEGVVFGGPVGPGTIPGIQPDEQPESPAQEGA